MAEEQLKYLDYIQNNITRMNQCSFQIKGLEVTIATALLAVYASSITKTMPEGNKYFIIIAVIVSFVFWAFDSYYLCKEKDYRKLYDYASGLRETNLKIKLFCMDTNVLDAEQTSIIKTMMTKTEVGLYGTVIIGLLLIITCF